MGVLSTVNTRSDLDTRSINTIRALSIDGVQKANSGHPGMPLGAAPMAYTLWTRFLRHNPQNPLWPDRDRFVLSAGHGSMLLYSLLHLTGYDLPLEELKRFRQWGSLTPGHPEYGHTAGVETTTGPLGQGFANGVGMAMAERWLAEHFNRPGHTIVQHYTYAIVGDGDLMEGITAEAASLAGHLRLGKLIYLYDDNHISIEGDTEITFSEDLTARFAAYGWHVQRVADGNDVEAIAAAIVRAQEETDRPSLIAVRTHIGFGSPNKQDNAEAHGAPLGAEEVRLTKRALGWPEDREFYVPDEVAENFRQAVAAGAEREADWQKRFGTYRAAFPDLAAEWDAVMAGTLPDGWEEALPRFETGSSVATRSASGKVLNAVAPLLPSLVGGSADLGPSNETVLKGMGEMTAESFAGRNIHFGVREHAMGSIMNGMTVHGGFRTYGGTFLIFSEYMRPPIRMAALMKLPVVFVFTHDSIGLGEDGPTHQPIEQLPSLRSIPNLVVLRPADAVETVSAWKVALTRRDGPTALILSRQKLPVLDRSRIGGDQTGRGAYILSQSSGGQPDLILMGTGSEVPLLLEAQKLLEADGTRVRVISVPSMELFNAQDASYRDAVLPPAVRARVAVEAAGPGSWYRYVGLDGDVVGMNGFGASAPAEELFVRFGFTAENVAERARAVLERNRK